MSVRSVKFLVAFFCTLAIAMSASAGRVGLQSQKKAVAPAASEDMVGKMAPDFNLDNVQGGKTRLADFRGKYVVLDFWGTWCAPCIAGIPELKEAYKEIDKSKFEFVSVCKNCENVKSFTRKKNMKWVQLLDDEETSITPDYSITGFPTLMVINPEGKVVANSRTTHQGLRGDLLATLEEIDSSKSE